MGKAYDQAVQGSVVIYDIDPATMTPVDAFLVASGLLWPCSGGATPRKTWLTCEEGTHFTGAAALPKKHGYVFEIPSTAGGQIMPAPLKAMGRFVHEAAVTDPKTGIVYMTEDDTPAGFFRFVPNDRNNLAAGGTLQMLAVQGQPGYDTRKHQTVGRDLRTAWVMIPDADPDLEGGGPAARVAKQGIALGGATFDYLEGEDFKNGAVTFAKPTAATRTTVRCGVTRRRREPFGCSTRRTTATSWTHPTTSRSVLAAACSCARTGTPGTSCADSPPLARCSTSPRTSWEAAIPSSRVRSTRPTAGG
ncbi:MAG: alkaline phosphatase PhoX [Actinomycetota bacterium]